MVEKKEQAALKGIADCCLSAGCVKLQLCPEATGEDGDASPPEQICLNMPKMQVGRSKTSEIVLGASSKRMTISRSHAIITATCSCSSVKHGESMTDRSRCKVSVHIEDLNSLNGTYVNKQRVSEALLSVNDELILGGSSKHSSGQVANSLWMGYAYIVKVSHDCGRELNDRSVSASATQKSQVADLKGTSTSKELYGSSVVLHAGKKRPRSGADKVCGAPESEKKVKHQALSANASNRKETNRLHGDADDELICAICCDFLFDAHLLECSHNFCRRCIEQWLRTKLLCPECRKPVCRPPMPNRVVQNLISRIKADCSEWKTRKMEEERRAKEDSVTLRYLLKRIQGAAEEGLTFLNIRSQWTLAEKSVFQSGLQLVSTRSLVGRTMWCDAVGMTDTFIDQEPDDVLKRAARNLDLDPNSDEFHDQISLRNRLRMFARYS